MCSQMGRDTGKSSAWFAMRLLCGFGTSCLCCVLQVDGAGACAAKTELSEVNENRPGLEENLIHASYHASQHRLLAGRCCSCQILGGSCLMLCHESLNPKP